MAGFVLDRLEHKFQVGARVWVSGYHYLGQGTVVKVVQHLFEAPEYVVEFNQFGQRRLSESRLEEVQHG